MPIDPSFWLQTNLEKEYNGGVFFKKRSMHIIGGIHKRRLLNTPKGKTTRPSSGMLRESLFNILQTYIEGTQFLDLFAGAGAIGLEALSRGAAFSTFVEKDKQALLAIQKNIEALKEQERCHLVSMDVFEALKFLEKKQKRFNIIFADPPYNQNMNHRLLQWIDTHDLLTEDGELFLEDSVDSEPLLEAQNLILKSERHLGHSLLYQFCRK